MMGINHHTQLLSVEMRSWKFFCPGWPGTMILLVSVSQAAGITGMSHLLQLFCFETGTLHVATVGLELAIPLSHPQECTPHLASIPILIIMNL
jgi:hypothetical protein